jgi:DNA-binding transcriptional LysR family regulator
MEQQQIEAFLSVVQTGSFSAAAQALYVAQPTLSRRIESLEAELGCQLFDRGRGRRCATLTQTGLAMVDVAHRWMSLWTETQSLVKTGGRPVMRISAYQTLSLSIMPHAICRIVGLGLPLKLDLFTTLSKDAYPLVEKGELDLAFVAQSRHSELAQSVPLYTEPLTIACSKDSPYFDGMSPRELDGSKAVRLEASQEHAIWHNYWFGDDTYALRADGLAFATQLLHQGGYWVVAPLTLARWLERTENLRCLRCDNMPPDRTTHYITREPSNPTHQAIAAQVKSVADELMGA